MMGRWSPKKNSNTPQPASMHQKIAHIMRPIGNRQHLLFSFEPRSSRFQNPTCAYEQDRYNLGHNTNPLQETSWNAATKNLERSDPNRRQTQEGPRSTSHLNRSATCYVGLRGDVCALFKISREHRLDVDPWIACISHLDLLLELCRATASERWVPAQQQVRDDADAPHVARSREVGAADHLRRHVHLLSNRSPTVQPFNARGCDVIDKNKPGRDSGLSTSPRRL